MILAQSQHRLAPHWITVVMLIGATVIMLCQWFSTYPPVQELEFFNLFGLEHRRWLVGRRELVHFVGFIGCALFGWSLARSLTISFLRRAQTYMAIIATLWFMLAKYPPNFIGIDLAIVLNSLRDEMLIYGVLVGVGLLVWRLAPRLLKSSESLFVVALVLLTISLAWELVCQPLFGFLRSPDRTGLDAAQIIIDLLGITVGVLVVKKIRSYER
ncbi:hypothetical protein [Pseudomonas spelaei]